MNTLLNIVAKILSVVLYPLFVPTYGIVLFCCAYSMHVAPLAGVWMAVAIIGTLILTCLLPITAIWIMMKKGEVKDLDMNDPRERTIPYLYSALGFGFWSYLLVQILHAPVYICCVAIGGTLAIGLVAVINRWWKISAHLTGFGGLVGGLMSYCLGLGAFPTWGTLCLWLGISWALMWARLYLNAHTPAQVCSGWLLGLTCTFAPFCILNYVL